MSHGSNYLSSRSTERGLLVVSIYLVVVLRVPPDDNYLSCCSSEGGLLMITIYPVVVLREVSWWQLFILL